MHPKTDELAGLRAQHIGVRRTAASAMAFAALALCGCSDHSTRESTCASSQLSAVVNGSRINLLECSGTVMTPPPTLTLNVGDRVTLVGARSTTKLLVTSPAAGIVALGSDSIVATARGTAVVAAQGQLCGGGSSVSCALVRISVR